jgi:hypothetical protein
MTSFFLTNTVVRILYTRINFGAVHLRRHGHRSLLDSPYSLKWGGYYVCSLFFFIFVHQWVSYFLYSNNIVQILQIYLCQTDISGIFQDKIRRKDF